MSPICVTLCESAVGLFVSGFIRVSSRPFAVAHEIPAGEPSVGLRFFAAILVRLTLANACSITYTLLPLAKQIPVQVSPNSYANNALNWLRLIRGAIRYAKSLAVSALSLLTFLKSSVAWNRPQAKPLLSRSPGSWSSILISCWPWPAKSRPNYKPSSVNGQNYSPTSSAH